MRFRQVDAHDSSGVLWIVGRVNMRDSCVVKASESKLRSERLTGMIRRRVVDNTDAGCITLAWVYLRVGIIAT